MTACDEHAHTIDQLVREARMGKLSRGELLKRAGAAGLAIGLPSALMAAVDEAEGAIAAAPRGTMRIGVAFSAAGSNDPLPGPGPEGRLRNNAVFNFLFAFTKTGQLIPSLAEEATPNSRATVWTIKLRDGVTFHDGSPLTADDVVYTFKRILQPKTKAEGAGDIGMVDASGIRKIDRLTVRIPLKYAF
jgi:peptide/nickel transport system substrate-binding protein